jgi:hypothetical protein
MKYIVSLFLTVLFLIFAGLQYNDPDPWLWMPVYLLYALVSLSAAFKPLHAIWYLFFFLTAAIASWISMPAQWEGIGTEMMNENTEKARESLGLLICAVASLISKRIS